MQEMSKFTPGRYQTQAQDYNKKQLKVIEIIKKIAQGHQHNHVVYGEVVEVLKKKRLSKVFTKEELYWLCTEYWTIDILGMDKDNGSNGFGFCPDCTVEGDLNHTLWAPPGYSCKGGTKLEDIK